MSAWEPTPDEIAEACTALAACPPEDIPFRVLGAADAALRIASDARIAADRDKWIRCARAYLAANKQLRQERLRAADQRHAECTDADR